MCRRACITLDDNIRFFEELWRQNCNSIFQCAYLGMLQRLHEKFGCKFQLNMFYSDSPDSFSLSDTPSSFREEFERNAHWLKFSFHARHNEPVFPYYENDDDLLRDFSDVMQELTRVVGSASLAKTTTLHYVSATREGCTLLRRSGVRGLIGMFYDKPGRDALHYYIPCSKWERLRCGEFYMDKETDLRFARNDLILNQHSFSSIMQELQRLDELVEEGQHAPFLQLMTHEQYFYPDYTDYQPDFEKKLDSTLEFLSSKRYSFHFFEELL